MLRNAGDTGQQQGGFLDLEWKAKIQRQGSGKRQREYRERNHESPYPTG